MESALRNAFVGSGNDLGMVILSAIFAYIFICLATRLTGKRSTAKMNTFDWVVTVALGSMTATTVLVRDVSVLEGCLGVGTLLGLQFAASKLAAKSNRIHRVLTASPTLVFYEGSYLVKNMAQMRLTGNDILSAIRIKGYSRLEDVGAVIMEPTGDMSVIAAGELDRNLLKGVQGFAGENT